MQISTTFPFVFSFIQSHPKQNMLYQKFIATAVAFVVGLSVPTSAHPGEVEPILTSRQLELRQATANARHSVARKCDGAIKAFEARRRAKRSALNHKKHSTSHSTSCAETASPSGTSTANAPTYTTLQNVNVVFTISSLSLLTCHLLDYLRTDTGSH
jgi:hypothetical protein